ncbi:type IV secretion system DNA-binding domain-containing protein [Patescibacteria group bacterium]|nr:type IV secretion system DNA-binding domain-containing protein [Patescibacteria group bacterium]
MPQIAFDSTFDQAFLDNLLGNPSFLLGLGFIVLIFLLVVSIFIARYFATRRGKVAHAFERKVILITVPKDIAGENAQPPELQKIQEKIGVAETFFSTIAGLKAERGFKAWFYGRKDLFSLELVADNGKLSFYMAMPAHLEHYVEEQIQAQFPDAYIEEVPDYNIFSPKGIVAGRMLGLGKKYIFPIKTYKKSDSDPLNSIANALSQIDENDGAAIQIVIRPADKSWQDLGAKVASKMQQGKKIEDAMKEVAGTGFGKFFKGFVDMVNPPKKPESGAPEQYRLSPMEEEVVKGLEGKSSKAGVDANIRIIVCSENKVKIDQYLNNLTNAFSQYNVYKYGNGFEVKTRPIKRLTNDFIYRNFDESRKMILNTEELASLYHLPIPMVNETPNIQWLEAKKASPPTNMPKEGHLLGNNIYRGRKTAVFVNKADRRRHQYIIGMTGTGKSWYIEGQMMQDIANGEGCCYIDPHGDAIDHILERIPKERAEDVIVFDPGDIERPIGLNMLEYDTPEQKTFAVNEIMNILDKLYDLRATGGPMFEQYFKNACYLIMDDPESGSTMMEVPRVLADDDFRNMKLSKCKMQIVKDFWEKEALKAGGEASLQNMVPYITSKLTPFIANDFMRPIISQQKSSLNFRDVMDNKKILLAKLSKGKIGDNNAYLLGMILIGKLLMAALARGDMPEDERKDFYLYIDEFQNFLTDSMEIILSEARKYRLCLTIAHQYIGQLVKSGDTKFKDAIFGNVGTKVAFRIGVDDAEALTKEFAPVFGSRDFLNVPAYNAYIKLMIDNANPPGFNMGTIHLDKIPGLPKKNPELAKAISQLSRLKFGKDRDIIEMEVAERIKQSS